jgi:alginate production protein
MKSLVVIARSGWVHSPRAVKGAAVLAALMASASAHAVLDNTVGDPERLANIIRVGHVQAPAPAREVRRDEAAGSGLQVPLRREERASDVFDFKLAQFQLPPSTPDGKPAALDLPRRLTYQYVYGSESTLIYRRDRDLNKKVRDNSNIIAPNINGVVIYRPADWLETTVEMIYEREFAHQEEKQVTLPSGEVVRQPRRRPTLLVDQAYFTLKDFTAPFEFSAGRRNYEDERRSLFDTSLDVVGATFRQGRVRAEFFFGREVWKDLDLAPKSQETRDRINTYVGYLEWRGIENLKIAGFAIHRNDWDKLEGQPRIYGLRFLGTPTENLSYWAEGAMGRGSDEARRKLSGYSWDAGATYRFASLPLNPNITLGYAYGSGDSRQDTNTNHEFRQSGLHSNERRFAGIPQFKVFGEVLDPDLTNIRIFTAGLGFRPTPGFSLDIIYHRYRLLHYADSIRNSAITEQMAQVDSQLSKSVGDEIDLVIGVRSLFGIRRLGLDFRTGWFKPGKAYLQNDGTDANPRFRKADKGIALVAKIWW